MSFFIQICGHNVFHFSRILNTSTLSYKRSNLFYFFSFFFLSQARAEAEARLQLESALREADKDHLRELEEIKEQLEKLLEEERQAKRDEELVRIAQAR